MATDSISLKMIQLSCPCLLPFLTILMENRCLFDGIFPYVAHVIPVSKLRTCRSFKNVCLINIILSLCKVFAEIINHQFRFVHCPVKYSNSTNLSTVADDILTLQDFRFCTVFILTNLVKAFETMNLSLLF